MLTIDNEVREEDVGSPAHSHLLGRGKDQSRTTIVSVSFFAVPTSTSKPASAAICATSSAALAS